MDCKMHVAACSLQKAAWPSIGVPSALFCPQLPLPRSLVLLSCDNTRPTYSKLPVTVRTKKPTWRNFRERRLPHPIALELTSQVEQFRLMMRSEIFQRSGIQSIQSRHGFALDVQIRSRLFREFHESFLYLHVRSLRGKNTQSHFW